MVKVSPCSIREFNFPVSHKGGSGKVFQLNLLLSAFLCTNWFGVKTQKGVLLLSLLSGKNCCIVHSHESLQS